MISFDPFATRMLRHDVEWRAAIVSRSSRASRSGYLFQRTERAMSASIDTHRSGGGNGDSFVLSLTATSTWGEW